MKNQYFGDNRDLFKYDLIEFILNNNKTSSNNRFTFIPMLTKNKGTNGNKIHNPVGGGENKLLRAFLKKCRDENRKNIKEIKTYFNLNHNIEIAIYRENEYFSHKNREEYFEGIDYPLLSNPLIFVDPDNGLEVKWSNEKHLLYSEVRRLYKLMNDISILMTYQHFPRENHRMYCERRCIELKGITGELPIFISDNEIIFFLITKNREIKNQLAEKIMDYKESYKDLKIGCQFGQFKT